MNSGRDVCLSKVGPLGLALPAASLTWRDEGLAVLTGGGVRRAPGLSVARRGESTPSVSEVMDMPRERERWAVCRMGAPLGERRGPLLLLGFRGGSPAPAVLSLLLRGGKGCGVVCVLPKHPVVRTWC